MIKLDDLGTELSEVSSNELESISGGKFYTSEADLPNCGFLGEKNVCKSSLVCESVHPS